MADKNSIEKKWYVARAVSGQENKIKNYIENEISRLGLQDYVIVHLPDQHVACNL